MTTDNHTPLEMLGEDACEAALRAGLRSDHDIRMFQTGWNMRGADARTPQLDVEPDNLHVCSRDAKRHGWLAGISCSECGHDKGRHAVSLDDIVFCFRCPARTPAPAKDYQNACHESAIKCRGTCAGDGRCDCICAKQEPCPDHPSVPAAKERERCAITCDWKDRPHFADEHFPLTPAAADQPVGETERDDEVLREFGNTKVRIGLRQQGHMATVVRMLLDQATWEEIGGAIGWEPTTARRWYELESASLIAAAAASASPTEEERSERRREFFAGFNAGYNMGIATEKGKSLVLPPDVTGRYCANCGMFNLSCRSMSHFDGRPCCDKCAHAASSSDDR